MIDRNDLMNLRPLSPLVVRDNFATSQLTRQEIVAPPAAVTRLTPGLITAVNTFVTAVATAFGALLTAVGTEFADNPILIFLSLIAVGFLAAHLFVENGVISGNGWSFRIPTFMPPKSTGLEYGGGGYVDDYEWGREHGGDPYLEAESAQRLMHVVDEYKARYGDIETDVRNQRQRKVQPTSLGNSK